MDDARLAIDAGAFDDVVVELIALFLGDERGHTQGNTSIEQCAVKSTLFQTFLHRNILYRVIQKLIRRNGLRACSERTCGRTLRRYGLALSKLPLGRNILRGPDQHNFDAALIKRTKLTEQVGIV